MYSLDRIPVSSVRRATLRTFNPKKPKNLKKTKKPKNLIFFLKNLRFLPALVSNGIGTTLSIFIVGLGPKHFLRCDKNKQSVGYCSLYRSLQPVFMNIH